MKTDITWSGVPFRLLTRAQAEPLFAGLLNFAGEALAEWGFSIPDDGDGRFLVADESVDMESLILDVHLPEEDGLFVLGVIFRKDLRVRHGVVGFDTDHSPLLIVHGDLAAQNVYLFGNAHYVGGDLRCESLLGKYNHGTLWVRGSVAASLVYSDDMDLCLGRLEDQGGDGAPTVVHSVGGGEVQRRAEPGEPAGESGCVWVPNRGRLAGVVAPRFLEDRPQDGEEEGGADPHQIELSWACMQIERGGSLLIQRGSPAG